eukprot:COSAG06_NODE_227_length_19736_cov_15.570708_19_plen_65_part_00
MEGELEYLFAPFSAFTVTAAEWREGTVRRRRLSDRGDGNGRQQGGERVSAPGTLVVIIDLDWTS